MAGVASCAWRFHSEHRSNSRAADPARMDQSNGEDAHGHRLQRRKRACMISESRVVDSNRTVTTMQELEVLLIPRSPFQALKGSGSRRKGSESTRKGSENRRKAASSYRMATGHKRRREPVRRAVRRPDHHRQPAGRQRV